MQYLLNMLYSIHTVKCSFNSYESYLHYQMHIKDGMEQSWVFIGGYSAQIFTWYPLSLIYVILILFTYFGSFFILLRRYGIQNCYTLLIG